MRKSRKKKTETRRQKAWYLSPAQLRRARMMGRQCGDGVLQWLAAYYAQYDKQTKDHNNDKE